MVKNTENKEILDKLQELEDLHKINEAVIRREEYKRAKEDVITSLSALLRESIIYTLISNREEYRLNKSVLPKIGEDCVDYIEMKLKRIHTNCEKRSYGRRRIW